MKRFAHISVCLILAFFLAGCGEKETSPEELVLGNWTLYRNRAYVLLIINPKGVWNSSVRIADVTSKIVSKKGDAHGTWHMEDGQLIFTVMESTIEKVWEKNSTNFFEIVELGDRLMLLKEENGRIAEWKNTSSQQSDDAEASASVIIPMAPIAVNLNKISSGAQDRFLCLSMKMVLKELMPGQEVPVFHPKAREAAIVFLSSLIYTDVQDFERVKEQKARLIDVLNPYMEGFIADIDIDRVIISTTIEKVEEFIIEHTIGAEEEAGEGENGVKEEA